MLCIPVYGMHWYYSHACLKCMHVYAACADDHSIPVCKFKRHVYTQIICNMEYITYQYMVCMHASY